MKTRTLKLALAVATTTLFVVPAMAQDNFPDVPENHWAFEAIENLKREGILVGYPDG
ncbi:MAG: S-layer homology domain-containing protein, partial [Armatimonadetes bacterium]|nr:S-layer homology domain-containing protein [Armatimonadota bacterium]